MGWRYLWFTSGALVFFMSIARVTIIRFNETPKFLVCNGEDEKVVKLLQDLAQKYGRPCDLTIEQLQRHGTIATAHSSNHFSFNEIMVHYKGLFATRTLAISTSLVWLSWTLIGLAYPLFYIFLPEYLSSRGAQFGQTSAYITWRNYVLAQFSAIFGPLAAAYLCKVPRIGRKYTMVVGAILTSKFENDHIAVTEREANMHYSGLLFRVHIRPQR